MNLPRSARKNWDLFMVLEEFPAVQKHASAVEGLGEFEVFVLKKIIFTTAPADVQ
jgi:hypothetical protein